MAMEGNAKRLPDRLRRFVVAATVVSLTIIHASPPGFAAEPDSLPGIPCRGFLATETAAIEEEVSPIERALLSRGSITFRKTSLQEVVFLLSD